MSPEQLRGDPTKMGKASDQYSLAVVLFELLCGRLPFDNSSSTITLLTNILTEEPRKLTDLRQGVDTQLVQIVDRDERDRSREIGPLVKADDALEVDTSGQTIEQVVDFLEQTSRGRLAGFDQAMV